MPKDFTNTVAEILTAHQGREGALLPILHDVQAALGHVPQDVLPQIAKALNISKAEVHGVVSFYHDFREAPAGRHVSGCGGRPGCRPCAGGFGGGLA